MEALQNRELCPSFLHRWQMIDARYCRWCVFGGQFQWGPEDWCGTDRRLNLLLYTFLMRIMSASSEASWGRLSTALVSSMCMKFHSSWRVGMFFSDWIYNTSFSNLRGRRLRILWTMTSLDCTLFIAFRLRSMSFTCCMKIKTSYCLVMRRCSHLFRMTIMSDIVLVWNIVLSAFHASWGSAISLQFWFFHRQKGIQFFLVCQRRCSKMRLMVVVQWDPKNLHFWRCFEE